MTSTVKSKSSFKQKKDNKALTKNLLFILIISLIFVCSSFKNLTSEYKLFTIVLCLISGIVTLYTLFRKIRDIEGRFSIPVFALIFYISFNGLAFLWAIAGKLMLTEFCRLLSGFSVFCLIICLLPKNISSVRNICYVIALSCGIFSVLSVDYASLGLFKPILNLFNNLDNVIGTGYEVNTRLTGIFGNANISAGVLGLGCILSIYLSSSACGNKDKIICTSFLSVISFAFLLGFSMGGLVAFAAGIAIYLIFAGNERLKAFITMLFVGIPTVAFAFVSFSYFGSTGFATFIPWICMILNALVSCILQVFVFPRIFIKFTKEADEAYTRKSFRFPFFACISAIALVAVYIVLAFNITGAMNIVPGVSIRRSVYPVPGVNTLSVDSSASVNVRIESQNMSEVMMHTSTVLYDGVADSPTFDVPEDSKVVYIYFSSTESSVLNSASLATGESIKLDYKFLPSFIENRIQGLASNENFIQRFVFMKDGLKVWMLSPIIGSGLGAFENCLSGVQSFYYETKYVHCNYIEVLVDSGIIGFISYIALLLGFCWLLFRNVRKDKGEFSAIYPALCSAIIFICCHSAIEVILSTYMVIVPFFAILGIITVCFQSDDKLSGTDAVTKSKKGPYKAPVHVKVMLIISAVVLFGYSGLISANKLARSIMNSHTDSVDSAYSVLDGVIALDRFETDDYYLTYLTYTNYSDSEEVHNTASIIAESIIDKWSNSNYPTLIQYYIECGKYDMAYEAAYNGIKYNNAWSTKWDEIFAVFINDYEVGESTDLGIVYDRDALADCILRLYDLLDVYNPNLMQPVELDSSIQAFIDSIK